MSAGVVPGLGAVVLCGGHSRRMGRPKAWLPFGGEALLSRVVRRVGEAAWPIAVVAAPGQDLPALPEGVRVVRDEISDRGPLQGIAAGLAALEGEVERAYVSSTDVPFLDPAFVRRMAALQAGGYAIAVLRDGGHHHPLAAVYACAVRADVAALLEAGRLRPFFLFERVRTLIADRAALLADPELAAADPELRSLLNLNTPEEYAAALAEAERGAGDLREGARSGSEP